MTLSFPVHTYKAGRVMITQMISKQNMANICISILLDPLQTTFAFNYWGGIHLHPIKQTKSIYFHCL